MAPAYGGKATGPATLLPQAKSRAAAGKDAALGPDRRCRRAEDQRASARQRTGPAGAGQPTRARDGGTIPARSPQRIGPSGPQNVRWRAGSGAPRGWARRGSCGLGRGAPRAPAAGTPPAKTQGRNSSPLLSPLRHKRPDPCGRRCEGAARFCFCRSFAWPSTRCRCGSDCERAAFFRPGRSAATCKPWPGRCCSATARAPAGRCPEWSGGYAGELGLGVSPPGGRAAPSAEPGGGARSLRRPARPPAAAGGTSAARWAGKRPGRWSCWSAQALRRCAPGGRERRRGGGSTPRGCAQC